MSGAWIQPLSVGLGAVTGMAVGAWGGEQSAKVGKSRFRKTRRQWSAGYESAIDQSDILARQAVSSQEFQDYSSYLMSTSADPLNSQIAKNYTTRLRQRQVQQGMYFSGGADEARRLAGLSETIRQQLLPELQSLVGYQERYRQAIFPLLSEQYTRQATRGAAGAGGIGMFYNQGGVDPTSAALAMSVQGGVFGAQVGKQVSGYITAGTQFMK